MRILYLILKNYKRLLLSNITKIEYKPEEKMQIIVGSNGSGKSSLLKELSPLPAIKNEFTNEGYKEIGIEYNNNVYILISDFTNPHTHQFILNGVDLNETGMFSIQKELVKQYFNLTYEIFELLISSNSFTKYSLLERRKWFTMLSETDYTFVLSTYQKIKDRQKDIQSGIKLNKAKLTTLKTNILSEEDISLLKNEINEKHTRISDLLELKVNNFNSNGHLLESNSLKIENTLNSLKLIIKNHNYDFLNIDLESILVKLNTEKEYIKADNLKLEKKLLEYQEIQSIMNKNDISNLNDIKSEIDNLNTELIKLSKITRYKIDSNPNDILSSLNANLEIFNYIFNNLKPNIDKKYSSDNYNNLKIKLNETNNLISQYETDIEILNREIKNLDHLKNHDPIQCPKCNNEWILGYDENLHITKINTLNNLNNELNNIKAIKEKLDIELEDMDLYINLYKQLINIKNNFPILKPLFDILEEKNLIFNNPESINSIIFQFKVDLNTHIEIFNIKNRLAELNHLLSTANTNIDINTLINEISLNISSNIKNIERINNDIQMYKNLSTTKSNILKYTQILNDQLDLNDEIYKNKLIDIQNTTINEIINQIKFELIDEETKLNNSLNIHNQINALENTIIEYEQELILLNNLLDVLSPTNGLIGNSILGFISAFIDQINNIIKQIWSYPMIIHSCTIDEDNNNELSYRFPVQVKTNNTLIPDIKKVSSGMQEIIDLAFKIIAMKYLGLENYPLYLDEFGRTFDSYHRQSAINIINNLLLQSDFSQIFLISHYEDAYCSIANSNINILCKENIGNISNDSNKLITY